MKKFVVVYISVSALYFLVKPYLFTEAFYEVFNPLLANLAAWGVWIFDETMVLEGNILLVQNGSGVWVTEECSALNYCWFLMAAVAAYPVGLKLKLVSVLIALLAVQLLNILRLVSLYVVQKWQPEYFDLVHLDVWPLLFVCYVVFVFLMWVLYVERNQNPDEKETEVAP